MKTKTTPKTAEKAQPSVIKPKAVAKATQYHYANLLTEALGGKWGDLIQRYYTSAIKNHKREKTVFPRPRNAATGLLKVKDVPDWMEAHRLTSIPSSNKVGQRLFDEMMVEVKQMPA